MSYALNTVAAEKTSRLSGRPVIYLIAAFLIAFVAWSANAPLDEIVRGVGRVVPTTQTQIVQNLEGGIVDQIFVVEGDEVQIGDPIAKMNDTQFKSTYQELQEQRLAAKLRLARLNAERDASAGYNPDPVVAAEAPEYAASELELFSARQNDLAAKLELANAQAALKRREVEMLKPMVARKAVAEIELVRAEQAVVDAEGASSTIQNEFEATRSLEYAETLRKLLQVEVLIRTREDQLARTNVTSPVHGIINKVSATTIGGVIKPGDALVEIIPLDETLRIEGKITPRDIGFVYVGMPASIKLTAFDFSIYGTLQGTVVHVGADTVVDPTHAQAEPYYEVYVSVDKTQLEGPDGTVDIRPGMQAEVELESGQKTVLEYLFKPLAKTTEAFSER